MKRKIIYLLGRGRSGSTLFSSILGSQEYFINVGELKNFHLYYTRSDKMSRNCMDGIPIKNHPFWKKVIKNFGEDVPNLQSTNIKKFKYNNQKIYDVIFRLSAKKYIIDSSKKISHLRRLFKTINYDLFTVLMIKDPRKYALSIIKGNKRRRDYNLSGRGNEFKTQKTSSLILKLLLWNIYYIYILTYFRLTKRKLFILRYEDLIKNPKKTVEHIYSYIGFENKNEKIVSEIKPQISFSGNPFYFESTDKKLNKNFDVTEISNIDWFVYTILTFPTNLIYNYSLFREKK